MCDSSRTRQLLLLRKTSVHQRPYSTSGQELFSRAKLDIHPLQTIRVFRRLQRRVGHKHIREPERVFITWNSIGDFSNQIMSSNLSRIMCLESFITHIVSPNYSIFANNNFQFVKMCGYFRLIVLQMYV